MDEESWFNNNIWKLLFTISYYLVPVGSILSVIGLLRNARNLLLAGVVMVSIAGAVFSLTEIISLIYRVYEKYRQNKNSNKPL